MHTAYMYVFDVNILNVLLIQIDIREKSKNAWLLRRTSTAVVEAYRKPMIRMIGTPSDPLRAMCMHGERREGRGREMVCVLPPTKDRRVTIRGNHRGRNMKPGKDLLAESEGRFCLNMKS